jgi:hypothetical protein
MTNTPKLWGNMTDAQKGALLLAALEGSEIQMSTTGSTYWHDVNPKWGRNSAYRIKPKAPKVETVEHECHIWTRIDGSSAHYGGHDYGDTNHNITHTYTITDGVVTACDTIIHENKDYK